MQFHQVFVVIKNQINQFSFKNLKKYDKNSKFDKLSEIYVLGLTLPVLINWGIYNLNFSILRADRVPGGYLDRILNVQDIKLPFLITNFWTQLIWTLIFLFLTIKQIKKTKTTDFSLIIRFVLIPFLYFVTFGGSFLTIVFLWSPNISIFVFFTLITTLTLLKILGKNWLTFCFLLVLWTVFVNLLGAFVNK